MTTPVHVAANLGVFIILQHVWNIDPNYPDLALILSSNLIDLDHLFSKPVYDPRRNSFATHFLHKNWRVVLLLSLTMILFRPFLFLGVGLIMHFFLDYLYNKKEGI